MSSIVMSATDLLEALPEIEERVRRASSIALFLDFDGTISSIVPSPADAELDAAIRPVVQALALRPDFMVTIVSGRALEDVRERMGLPGLCYIGNHGLETECNGNYVRDARADSLKPELRRIRLQLELALGDVQGVEIEDKGFSLAVHFRRVASDLHDWIKKTTCEAVQGSTEFATSSGKMVVEVRPRLAVNKGTAVGQVVREVLPASALPIYIGDDVSDEDAFAVLPAGITVKVGEMGQTHAQYIVPDVAGVAHFLDWLTRTEPHGSFARGKRAG